MAKFIPKTFQRVRCNHRSKPGQRCCDARRTLAMPIGFYVRIPKCRVCGARNYREDRWRSMNEIGANGKKPCNCGHYPFPHRKGGGMCELNPALTAEMFEELALAARSRKR